MNDLAISRTAGTDARVHLTDGQDSRSRGGDRFRLEKPDLCRKMNSFVEDQVKLCR